jgi:membrane-associated phospholipid phosphatase
MTSSTAADVRRGRLGGHRSPARVVTGGHPAAAIDRAVISHRDERGGIDMGTDTGPWRAARWPGPASDGGSAAATTETALRELNAIDLQVYRAVARTPSPTLDGLLRRLSRTANRSKLWLVAAGGLAAFGGPVGRRAAGAGVAAIAVDSVVVNLAAKWVARRQRPDPDGGEVPVARRVPMPLSPAFPSGHSASGFTFANAVAQILPPVALPLRVLACAVAYSRVHTGVHYPGDVIAGGIVGATVGEAVGWSVWRVHAGRRSLPGSSR